MSYLNQITEKIEQLTVRLQKERKTGPANFFSSLLKNIQSSPDILSTKTLLLNEIRGAAALAQYGDFSNEEEKLFQEIQVLVEKELEVR